MKFEETVRHVMRSWPSICHTRALALDSLLMHFGNGTYWTEDSGIGNIYEEEDAAHPLMRAKKLHEEAVADTMRRAPSPSRDRELVENKDYYKRNVARIRHVLDNLEELASGTPCLVTAHFYPLFNKGRALIQHIPDDCPEDWVMGVREMCALILACPFEETEDKNLARNQQIAKRILKDLDKRFGKTELPDVSYATWKEEYPFSDTLELRKRMKKIFQDRVLEQKDTT